LLRHLLDYFHGNVSLAVGAYNGGLGRPNLDYENGVRNVAEYARRILDRAAVLHGDQPKSADCAHADGCA
jgi:soluble lytic murein transglycosylase-like protein